MLDFIFGCLIIYVLYKLIFDFIVPVFKATSVVRERMRHMQQQPNQQSPQNSTSQKVHERPNSTVTDAEYIDYEEVKE